METTPTFFIRDVHNFPDLNRAVKRDPYTGMRNLQNIWDFWTLLPECFHQTTIVMSDRGIPDGFRHMNFFGNILIQCITQITKEFELSSVLKQNKESRI